jgi:hypothetical protein
MKPNIPHVSHVYCAHCGGRANPQTTNLCACTRVRGQHVSCAGCAIGVHNAAWLNPLSRDRIVRMDTTIGRKVFGHAARGNA